MKSTKGNCEEKEKVEKNKPWRRDEWRDGWVQIGSGGVCLDRLEGETFGSWWVGMGLGGEGRQRDGMGLGGKGRWRVDWVWEAKGLAVCSDRRRDDGRGGSVLRSTAVCSHLCWWWEGGESACDSGKRLLGAKIRSTKTHDWGGFARFAWDGFFWVWDFFCLNWLCCIFGLIWYFGALQFDDFAGFEKMVILRFLIFWF